MSENEIMIWSIAAGAFLVSLATIIYMVITAKPYPKVLQDAEDEEAIRKFKEYRDNRSQN